MRTATEISALALRAMLYEVTTTPKPGLVDCHNSGAHEDMDIFSFMASSSALSEGLTEIARLSEEHLGCHQSLFEKIRPVGVIMEQRMFSATEGINTHKGMIFLMGLATAAAVTAQKSTRHERVTAEEVASYIREMTKGLCSKDLKGIHEKVDLTNGERLYLQHGVTGVRGEAESGLSTLFKGAVDTYRESPKAFEEKNALFLQMLFEIMKWCDDSTILHRHDFETLSEVRQRAGDFLQRGGMSQAQAYDHLSVMNDEFSAKRISPGGSADLLAVCIFLGMLEGYIS